MRRRSLLGAILAAPLFLPRLGRGQDVSPTKAIDGGPYVPTPDVVVLRMLELAGVRGDDIVVDLGSGDGRLVIEDGRVTERGSHPELLAAGGRYAHLYRTQFAESVALAD